MSELRWYSMDELLGMIHDILAKPGEVSVEDQKDLETINKELIARDGSPKGV